MGRRVRRSIRVGEGFLWGGVKDKRIGGRVKRGGISGLVSSRRVEWEECGTCPMAVGGFLDMYGQMLLFEPIYITTDA